MPSGRVHTIINVGASLLLAGVFSSLGVNLSHPPFALIGAGVIIGTLLMTPDLDMLHVKTQARAAWGRLGWIWWPLLLVSTHRGVSHSYLRGPLIRAVYLAVMLTLLNAAAGAVTGFYPGAWLLTHFGWTLPGLHDWTWVAWVYLGYWLAQVSHLIADGIPLSFERL